MREWNVRGLRSPHRYEINPHVIHPIVHCKGDDVHDHCSTTRDPRAHRASLGGYDYKRVGWTGCSAASNLWCAATTWSTTHCSCSRLDSSTGEPAATGSCTTASIAAGSPFPFPHDNGGGNSRSSSLPPERTH